MAEPVTPCVVFDRALYCRHANKRFKRVLTSGQQTLQPLRPGLNEVCPGPGLRGRSPPSGALRALGKCGWVGGRGGRWSFSPWSGRPWLAKGPQRQGLAWFQRAQDFGTRRSAAGDTPARVLPDLVAAYEEKQLPRGRIPWCEARPVSLTLPANASRWMQLKLGGAPRPDTDTGCERVGHYAVPMG